MQTLKPVLQPEAKLLQSLIQQGVGAEGAEGALIGANSKMKLTSNNRNRCKKSVPTNGQAIIAKLASISGWRRCWTGSDSFRI